MLGPPRAPAGRYRRDGGGAWGGHGKGTVPPPTLVRVRVRVRVRRVRS